MCLEKALIFFLSRLQKRPELCSSGYSVQCISIIFTSQHMLEMVPSCGSRVRLRLPHDLGPFCDPLVMYRVWKAIKGPAKSSPSEALSPEGKVRRGSSEGSWFAWLAASLGQRFCFLLLINKHCRGAWGVTAAGKTPGRSGVRAISPAKRGSVPVTGVPLISLFFPGIRKHLNEF